MKKPLDLAEIKAVKLRRRFCKFTSGDRPDSNNRLDKVARFKGKEVRDGHLAQGGHDEHH
jgi:hypothetical protein